MKAGIEVRFLKQLINTPKTPLMRDECRWLGDAVFAFFCPEDAEVLITNVNDRHLVAAALNKPAKAP